MKFRLDGNFDDNRSDLLHLLSRLEPIFGAVDYHKWEIHAERCRYLGPFTAVIFGALFRHGQLHRQSPKIRLPEEPERLAAFCQYSNMHYWFRAGKPANPENKDNETVPLHEFHDASWGLADGIMRLIRRHRMDDLPEFEFSLRACIYEIAQNVVDHSDSAVGGIMCARYFHSMDVVRVAITDLGVGIPATIGSAFPKLADPIQAIHAVLRGGVSARSRVNNQGHGLSNLWLIVKRCRGDIILVTDRVNAAIDRGTESVAENDFRFPGTFVGFSLPVSGIES